MSSPSLVIHKGIHEDPATRIAGLISAARPKFRSAFLGMVRFIRNRRSLDEIADLLATGRVDQALREVEAAARTLGATWSTVYTTSAERTATFFGNRIGIVIDFDRTASLAVQEMQLNQTRILGQFTNEQIRATRTALAQGIQRGLDARGQANLLLRSIGMTSRQVTAAGNYRRLLETLSAEALQRELRDRSFDIAVRAAIQNQEPLTPTQINRMVRRYEDQLLAFRAQIIASFEAQAASNAGLHEMYRQAIEGGIIDPASIQRTWNTRGDTKVRDPAHTRMRGQVRDFFTPFRSGIGGFLRFPTDPTASAADTAGCRCRLSIRFRDIVDVS